MIASPRIVLPELLDELEPNDPRARRSRRDLRYVHRAMRSLSILQRAIARLRLAAPPKRILELGAGDASLMLRLAQAQRDWGGVALTILDRHDLLSKETRDAYQQLGWDLTVVRANVIEWAKEVHAQHFDLCVTTLFLHHFDRAALSTLMAAIAAESAAFVACEPRRNAVSWLASQFVGILGANAVTRHDAVTSVGAGFVDRELMESWPKPHADWCCEEYAAPPFTHCFAAVRKSVRRG
ncbi:MAG: class I SAM-dependent methyltransferase [Pseudomonadota bacterium]|nr:class I SAM-dependent methyltransferase [Pseudomonadota bacterium]